MPPDTVWFPGSGGYAASLKSAGGVGRLGLSTVRRMKTGAVEGGFETRPYEGEIPMNGSTSRPCL